MPNIGELLSQYNIIVKTATPGRYYTTCPQCSAKRRRPHQKLKCLGVTIKDDRVYWGCNHCGWTGPEKGAYRQYSYANGFKARPNGGHAFVWQKDEGDPGLYRIEEALEADGVILIAEGEKDVDSLWTIGFPATCGPHGANTWTRDYSERLKGRDLVVLNDNDAPGYAYAKKVVEASMGVARSVRRLDLKDYWPEIGQGEDVSDWLAKGGGSAEWLETILADLPVINGHDGQETPQPLPIANIANWDGLPVPDQEWAVNNRIPLREVCLFSGEGAAGKSTIALHLCAACALGRDWLSSILEPAPAFFIDAEDDIGVVWRRLDAVRKHYQTTFAEMWDGGLRIISLHGQDTVLASGNPRSGIILGTGLYDAVLSLAKRTRPKIIVLASSANFYAGNEIDRSQVRQFISMLTRIAIEANGAVILISHPSLSGMSNGSGISGSTAWHNSVRARMYLTGAKDDAQDTDFRLLEFRKNQYGPVEAGITLRYRDGMFMQEGGGAAFNQIARNTECDEIFLKLLDRFTSENRSVSPNKSSTWAASMFSAQPEAKDAKMSRKELEEAMERLFQRKIIHVIASGPPSKRREFLARNITSNYPTD